MPEFKDEVAEDLSAIAFDLDGTLYSRRHAFRNLMAEWVETAPGVGNLDAVIAADQNGYAPRLEFFEWLHGELELGTSGEDLWQRFRQELPNHIRPSLDVAQEIADLQLEYTMAVLTNGSSEFQRAKLRATGLSGFFPGGSVLVSEDLGAEKPDPRAFKALIEYLDLPPDYILYVGDHWENDILGARSAGLLACWLADGREAPPHNDAYIFIADTLEELLGSIDFH